MLQNPPTGEDAGNPGPGTVLVLAVVFEGGMFLGAVALGWLLGHPPVPLIHASWSAIFWSALATAPLTILMVWIVASDWPPFRRLRCEVEDLFVPLFADRPLSYFAIIALLAGLGEEALFRGVIQNALTDPLGPWLALATTSALFGLMHLVTKTYAILAALVGAYLGWLAMVGNNLLIPILTHAAYDFVALVYIARHLHAEPRAAARD